MKSNQNVDFKKYFNIVYRNSSVRCIFVRMNYDFPTLIGSLNWSISNFTQSMMIRLANNFDCFRNHSYVNVLSPNVINGKDSLVQHSHLDQMEQGWR